MSILKRIERLEKKLQKPIKYVVRWKESDPMEFLIPGSAKRKKSTTD